MLFWQENFISEEAFLERLFIFTFVPQHFKNIAKEKITEVRGKFLRYYSLFRFIGVRKIMKERFSFIFMVAGIGFFITGFVFQMLGPIIFLKDIPMKTVEELAKEDADSEFYQLAEDYPIEFKKYFVEPTPISYAEALRLGRDIYIAEACWHCHSQYIRPVANEPIRYGEVSTASEYQNELQLPQLFGTRRVGPDLIREAGVHSNDWHIAHFFEPASVQPGSVMPSYRWFFDENGRPNKKGLAIAAYVQWLGSWKKGV